MAPGLQLPLGQLEGPGTEGLRWVLMLLFLLPTSGDLLSIVQVPLLSEEKGDVGESKRTQRENSLEKVSGAMYPTNTFQKLTTALGPAMGT